MIEPRLCFKYADIDLDTGMCIGVRTQSYEVNNPVLVPISVDNPEYLFKYHINGNWYEDAEGAIPWQSSMV